MRFSTLGFNAWRAVTMLALALAGAVNLFQPHGYLRLRTELWSWMLKDPQMEQRDGYLVPRGAP